MSRAGSERLRSVRGVRLDRSVARTVQRRAAVRARAIPLRVEAVEEPQPRKRDDRPWTKDLRPSGMWQLPHAAVLHEQQTLSRCWLHRAARTSAAVRHYQSERGHRPGTRATHTQRHRLLQGAIPQGRLVPRSISSTPVRTLDDWFDHARLQKTPGHPFGLDLSLDDRRALIAFLNTL